MANPKCVVGIKVKWQINTNVLLYWIFNPRAKLYFISMKTCLDERESFMSKTLKGFQRVPMTPCVWYSYLTSSFTCVSVVVMLVGEGGVHFWFLGHFFFGSVERTINVPPKTFYLSVVPLSLGYHENEWRTSNFL